MAKIKDNERLLKASREKQLVTYKGTPIRQSIHFSAESLEARRKWHNTLKMIEGKNLQPGILYAGEFPGGPVVRILCFHCRWHGFRQAKAKRVQHHYTGFTRNSKHFFSKQKRTQLKYEKYERKNLIGKGKHTVKAVDQPLIKLVGRLKDK